MLTSEPRYKIPLVDDDTDFVAAGKTALESRPNYKVLTANDGAFGLLIAKGEKPDLIILDVIMPFEDGFTAARKLKAEHELVKIPIIIVASFPQRMGETDISISRNLELEAEDYVERPIGPHELLVRVDRLLKAER
jgi:DNA-binding response OmpR family regulator